jgi:hypothetical protein
MGRPVAEGPEADEKDLTALHVMLKRAKIHSTRSKERKLRVCQLYAELVSIFTEELTKTIRRTG